MGKQTTELLRIVTDREDLYVNVPFHWVTLKKGIRSYEPTKDSRIILNQFKGWSMVKDTLPF